MIQENLNKENFWNEMHQKYPLAMNDFCGWIDYYKKTNNWGKLFNDSYHQLNKKFASNGELTSVDFSTPKFHDLPLALQMGIWREYLEDELNIERCKIEIESYLYGAQEGISQVAENLKNGGRI